MAGHGKAAVIKAICGNGIITIAKGVAAFFTGSGAMVAECIHSAVDTLNQGLLLIGHHRSLSKPNPRFPYGFGPEAGFWGLLAAIGVLIFGGALTLQHAVHALAHPEMPDHIWVAVGVLTFSALLEAWITYSVIKDVGKTRNGQPWWAHIKAQGPGTLTVILEDTAAVFGCLFALAAILMCQITQNGIWDAIAQVAIGGMLSAVGLYLVWSNRGLLVGQAIAAKKVNEIQVFIADIDGIDQVLRVKTRQLSAHQYRLKAEIVISGGMLAGSIIPDYKERLDTDTDDDQTAEFLGRFANDLFIRQAHFIDHIESLLSERFPGAIYIDLEPHYEGEGECPNQF